MKNEFDVWHNEVKRNPETYQRDKQVWEAALEWVLKIDKEAADHPNLNIVPDIIKNELERLK